LEEDQQARFEELIMPHLDAAYNLARWLTRNEHDAQDVVQDAFLRAFKFFGGFRGGNSRYWLLSIVRNAGYTWLEKNRKRDLVATAFDEEIHSAEDESSNPQSLALKNAGREILLQALEELPVEFREVMVLRELEGMSYKEIAGLANVPIGTVMSRLARGRKHLLEIVAKRLPSESSKTQL
jgi:RNA polymerase sigma-70 factor (ECF subfamily)